MDVVEHLCMILMRLATTLTEGDSPFAKFSDICFAEVGNIGFPKFGETWFRNWWFVHANLIFVSESLTLATLLSH